MRPAPCPEPDVAATLAGTALDALWQRAQHQRLTPEERAAAPHLEEAKRLLSRVAARAAVSPEG